MFLTLEDETGIVHAVVWPSLFKQQRRVSITASMMGIRQDPARGRGRSPSGSKAVRLFCRSLKPSERDSDFPIPHGRGDEVKHGAGPDPRKRPIPQAREIYIPDLHTDTLKVKSRNFH